MTTNKRNKRNVMKKSAGFFAASLIFLLACLCLPAETALGDSVLTSRSFMIKGEEQEGPLYDYILLADQSVRIVKCYDVSYFEAIPESIDGYVVSEIGEYSYSGSDLSSLHLFIPDCVTSVRQNAFGEVFARLYLEVSETHPTLKVENGMLISQAEKRIIRGGFINELIIPEGIEILDDHAFWGCPADTVYIPSSVTQIGRNPFAYCCSTPDTYYLLRSVELSSENAALEIQDGVLFSRVDHRLVWCFDDPRMKNSYDPFSYSYTIPEGTEMIDDFAFQRWSIINSVVVPVSVTQVGTNPFIGRTSLEGIKLDEGNSALILRDNMLISSEDHRLICCAAGTSSKITVPWGIEIIGDYAFRVMESWIPCEVILPDSVTVIGNNAFVNAQSAEIHIPAGVQWIGDYAFRDCGNIKELPEFYNRLTIGKGAFSNCIGIARLVVRNGAEIRTKAFAGCSNVEEIYLAGSASFIGLRAFADCRNLKKVAMAEGVKVIGASAFFHCGTLSEVELPESLLYIGKDAFSNVQNMEYDNVFGMYITVCTSTVHAVVSTGSYAEQYCKEYNIDFSVR